MPLLLIIAVSLSACSGLVKSLTDLTKLQAELIKEFHDQNVNVVIQNSTLLGITFINSKLNNETDVKRQERAQATASFVKTHYAGMAGIERIWVAFVAYETRFLIVNYTRTIDGYIFNKNGSLVRPPALYDERLGSQPDDEPRASYNPSNNQTGVHITALQLSGNMNEGLVLVPDLTLSGDARPPRKATIVLLSVKLTFASYAPTKTFKTDVPFVIIADGKTIYTATAHNTSTTTDGGNEFLVVAIPFPRFLAMAQAEEAALRLGNKRFPLTDKQLAALRNMTNYAAPTQR